MRLRKAKKESTVINKKETDILKPTCSTSVSKVTLQKHIVHSIL